MRCSSMRLLAALLLLSSSAPQCLAALWAQPSPPQTHYSSASQQLSPRAKDFALDMTTDRCCDGIRNCPHSLQGPAPRLLPFNFDQLKAQGGKIWGDTLRNLVLFEGFRFLNYPATVNSMTGRAFNLPAFKGTVALSLATAVLYGHGYFWMKNGFSQVLGDGWTELSPALAAIATHGMFFAMPAPALVPATAQGSMRLGGVANSWAADCQFSGDILKWGIVLNRMLRPRMSQGAVAAGSAMAPAQISHIAQTESASSGEQSDMMHSCMEKRRRQKAHAMREGRPSARKNTMKKFQRPGWGRKM